VFSLFEDDLLELHAVSSDAATAVAMIAAAVADRFKAGLPRRRLV
jgi:hypothetical protein